MKHIRFFQKKLMIKGHVPIIKFRDGHYRFWEVRNRKGEACLIFREMVGVVTIQQRLDFWLRHEAPLMGDRGLSMIFAHHIAPASSRSIGKWIDAHPKQMKKFELRLNVK